MSAFGGKADIPNPTVMSAFDPKRKSRYPTSSSNISYYDKRDACMCKLGNFIHTHLRMYFQRCRIVMPDEMRTSPAQITAPSMPRTSQQPNLVRDGFPRHKSDHNCTKRGSQGARIGAQHGLDDRIVGLGCQGR